MSFRVQKRKRLAKNTNANISKSGVSVSKKMGNVTVNSRGTGSVRIMPGFSYRFGKNAWYLALVFLAVAVLWFVVKLAFLLTVAAVRYLLIKPVVWGYRTIRNYLASRKSILDS
jgi:uncharacterized protein DUF4236